MLKKMINSLKSLGCKCRLHTGPFVTGLGGMGDATICLHCGIESYGSLFEWFATEVNDSNRLLVEAARNLPSSNMRSDAMVDPEFVKWIEAPIRRKDGSVIDPPWKK